VSAFRDADQPTVVERLGDVDDVSRKQIQLVVVARTVRLHRTVPTHAHAFSARQIGLSNRGYTRAVVVRAEVLS